MIRQEDVYRIGRIGKPHGVGGEVVLWCDDDVFDRVECDYLVLCIDGILVPFFIEEYRLRGAGSALMKFCDVDTQGQAAALTGCDVYFPKCLADTPCGAAPLASVVGYALVDASCGAVLGRIARVDDATANVLFVLDDGRLVPAADELVAGVDAERMEVSVRLPEGLLDMQP